MKGDFTRLTFRPQQHFTSVRMQQGRLQLDSDWNEQIDIQSHLYRTQVTDMIGSNSGTSNPTAFELKPSPSDHSTTPDLIISPGHFYVDGILCESDLSTPFDLTPLPAITLNPSPEQSSSDLSSKQVQVSTLVVDGLPLAKGQWLVLGEQYTSLTEEKLVQIVEVNRALSQLTLNRPISQATPVRRLITYSTQPNYPNPEPIAQSTKVNFTLPDPEDPKKIEVPGLKVDGRDLSKDQWIAVNPSGTSGAPERIVQIVAVQPVASSEKWQLTLHDNIKTDDKPVDRNAFFHVVYDYVLYLDVWERHVTAIEDPLIREKALGIPDTTTRTQTIWQLKLKPIHELPLVTNGTNENTNAEDVLRDRWNNFLETRRDRRALMSACARLCSNNANGNAVSEQPLENQLYRVEIHKPGKGGVATFKWSRDNASTASAIKDPDAGNGSNQDAGIKDNKIIIQFDQQEWQFSKSGQWLEITTVADESNGDPGVFVPFQSASLRQIVFDRSRLTGGDLPQRKNRIVRRWHVGDKPEILTSSEWTELERGIKVKFDEKSDYESGDYWLIPARVDDIEWPDDGAKQPLAQPPRGIEHHYGLLATVRLEPQGQFVTNTLDDQRLIFPQLQSCLGAVGGTVTGTLELQNDLYITHQGTGEDRIDGKLGIGTRQPIARFHLRNAPAVPGKGTLSTNGTSATVSGTGVADLHFGDVIEVAGTPRIVTAINSADSTATLNDALTISNAKFTYQPPIARLEDGNATPQVIVTATGNIGVGVEQPIEKLEVNGTIKTTALTATGTVKGDNLNGGSLTVTGNSSLDGGAIISSATVSNGLTVTGNSSLNGGAIISSATVSNGLTVTGNSSLNGGATISSATISNGLTVAGNSSLNGGAIISSATVSNGLTVTGNSSLNGNVTIDGNLTVTDNSKLTLGNVPVTKFSTSVSNSDQEVPTAKAIQTYVTSLLEGRSTRDFRTRNLTLSGNLKFDSGSTIIEGFSETLGNSNTKLPTEGAVTQYVNNNLNQIRRGSSTQDFVVQDLNVSGALKLLKGVKINQISDDDDLTSDSDEATKLTVPTQRAVKVYVDNQVDRVSRRTSTNFTVGQNLTVSGRAGIGGSPDPNEDITLRVRGTLVGDVLRGRVEPPSSQTLKENVSDLSDQETVALLNQLHPVKFTYKTDPDPSLHAGFIAEDSPDLLTSADKQAIKLTDIVAVLTKALQDNTKETATLTQVVQEHQQTIKNLASYINAQQREIVLLQTKLSELESKSSLRSWFR